MKRWNPFGGNVSQPTPAASPVAVLPVDVPHVVTPPDAKYFGLENVRPYAFFSAIISYRPAVWQYLVRYLIRTQFRLSPFVPTLRQ